LYFIKTDLKTFCGVNEIFAGLRTAVFFLSNRTWFGDYKNEF